MRKSILFMLNSSLCTAALLLMMPSAVNMAAVAQQTDSQQPQQALAQAHADR